MSIMYLNFSLIFFNEFLYFWNAFLIQRAFLDIFVLVQFFSWKIEKLYWFEVIQVGFRDVFKFWISWVINYLPAMIKSLRCGKWSSAFEEIFFHRLSSIEHSTSVNTMRFSQLCSKNLVTDIFRLSSSGVNKKVRKLKASSLSWGFLLQTIL